MFLQNAKRLYSSKENENFDLAICEKCDKMFHLPCNFIKDEKIKSQFKMFLCLKCRNDTSLLSGKKIHEKNNAKIKALKTKISKLSNESFKGILINSLKRFSYCDYCANSLENQNKLEVLFSEYDFSTIIKKKGTIYPAIIKQISCQDKLLFRYNIKAEDIPLSNFLSLIFNIINLNFKGDNKDHHSEVMIID